MDYVFKDVDKDSPQYEEFRLCFMAGAEHLFTNILNVLDDGDDITPNDERRMMNVQREITHWIGVLSNRINPPQGSA
jgi:hypothetical protein